MTLFIEKDGQVLPYQVTYKNNKHTYYRVKPGYVAVTANKRYPKALITSFLTTHFDRFYHLLHAHVVERDDQITLWGRPYELRVMDGNYRFHMDKDIVYLHTRQDVKIAKKRIYLDQLKEKAIELSQTIEPVLNHQGIKLIPVKYKYLKSKFGSYHRKHHDITLNTILATLDPIYLTYVLYHEYAHTKVFDHSKRFYALLDELMPGHKTIQKRLKNVVII